MSNENTEIRCKQTCYLKLNSLHCNCNVQYAHVISRKHIDSECTCHSDETQLLTTVMTADC